MRNGLEGLLHTPGIHHVSKHIIAEHIAKHKEKYLAGGAALFFLLAPSSKGKLGTIPVFVKPAYSADSDYHPTTIRLAWDLNTEPDMWKYIIQGKGIRWDGEERFIQVEVLHPKHETEPISLESDCTYTFAAYAVDTSDFSSDKSNEVVYTTYNEKLSGLRVEHPNVEEPPVDSTSKIKRRLVCNRNYTGPCMGYVFMVRRAGGPEVKYFVPQPAIGVDPSKEFLFEQNGAYFVDAESINFDRNSSPNHGEILYLAGAIHLNDKTPPILTVDEIPQFTNKPSIVVYGTVYDDSHVDVDLSGENLPHSGEIINEGIGPWSCKVDLKEGTNQVLVTAKDINQNMTEVPLTIQRVDDFTPPEGGLNVHSGKLSIAYTDQLPGKGQLFLNDKLVKEFNFSSSQTYKGSLMSMISLDQLLYDENKLSMVLTDVVGNKTELEGIIYSSLKVVDNAETPEANLAWNTMSKYAKPVELDGTNKTDGNSGLAFPAEFSGNQKGVAYWEKSLQEPIPLGKKTSLQVHNSDELKDTDFQIAYRIGGKWYVSDKTRIKPDKDQDWTNITFDNYNLWTLGSLNGKSSVELEQMLNANSQLRKRGKTIRELHDVELSCNDYSSLMVEEVAFVFYDGRVFPHSRNKREKRYVQSAFPIVIVDGWAVFDGIKIADPATSYKDGESPWFNYYTMGLTIKDLEEANEFIISSQGIRKNDLKNGKHIYWIPVIFTDDAGNKAKTYIRVPEGFYDLTLGKDRFITGRGDEPMDWGKAEKFTYGLFKFPIFLKGYNNRFKHSGIDINQPNVEINNVRTGEMFHYSPRGNR
ncbi:hypothetical protein KY366_08820 [Candidatus Woesearchaeota archaeon]|nr:hypothetical protein [Candidatus Woesearchaeota archaeon]